MSIKVALALMGLLCVCGRNAIAQSVSCAPLADTYAAAMLSGVTALASSSDDGAHSWRAAAKVPVFPASSVTLVSVDSVCDAAAHALASLPSSDGVVRPVWVIALGTTHYVVFDKRRTSAGHRVAAVFDATMNWIADFAA